LKHLTLSLEDEILVLKRYKLSSDELLVVRSILLYQDEQSNSLRELLSVYKSIGISFRDILISLQNKEIILKSYKIAEEGNSFDPNEIPINKNFLKILYRSSFEMGKELFEEYPQFGYIQGNMVPLRTVAKKFDSLEDAYTKYGKAINHNYEVHKKIIELVKWAKENNILNMSLASFIVNNSWVDLEALKDGDSGINYESVRLL
jgi:hypothetical protein